MALTLGLLKRAALVGAAALFVLALTLLAGAQELDGPADDPYRKYIPDTPPRTPEEQRAMFHLPPGFEIELVAAEPDIRKPMNLAFDDRGRLWATQSVEYPFPAKPDRAPRDTARIFEDIDGDGRADRVTTFADGLNIPIGVLPVSGGAIVYSIPDIYLFKDTDGDDRADQREVLYGSIGHDDTHGMTNAFTWGPDGWIYACHGFANNSEIKARDGSSIKLHSGNTYRMRPDGSHIEQITHGQVNPFGLSFDPLGNLYSCDCHSKPLYMLLRGAHYPSFGKPHDGLGFGPEMCPHDHGSTGIAGIVYYAADGVPPEYRDTIFIGNPVTNRINHDRLERHGSTLLAIEQPDFLVCDDPWFRPVDIELGPDGALYVADFYNAVIGHYEVPLTHPARDFERGRIWRISYEGADGRYRATASRRDWNTATAAELIDDLAHPNLVVRTKATNQLVERIGRAAVRPVRRLFQAVSSPEQRAHGVWVLERLGELDDATLRAAAYDQEVIVRTHAMKILGERAGLESGDRRLVLAALGDPDAFVQRAAAEALARHPSPENVQPLLELRDRVPEEDTHLLHAVRMALRDQLLLDETIEKLAGARLNETDSGYLADVCSGAPTTGAAALLLGHLQRNPEHDAQASQQVRHVARYVAEEELASLYAFAGRASGRDEAEQLSLLGALDEGLDQRGLSMPDGPRGTAVDLVRRVLAGDDESLVRNAISLAQSLKLHELNKELLAIATGESPLRKHRSDAIDALVAIDSRAQIDLLGRILTDPSEPAPLRQRVATVLGELNEAEAIGKLLDALPIVPANVGAHVAAALTARKVGAERLLDAIAAGKASARLLVHPLVKGRLEDGREMAALKERAAELTADLPPADTDLQDLIEARGAAFPEAQTDQERGAALFKEHCANCHSIDGNGGKVAPQLDGIAVRGVDRLLEDVLDPNRNVDQEFRSSVLALKSGKVVTGLIQFDDGVLLTVVDSQGKVTQVRRSDIEEEAATRLSPMPANVVDVIPEDDFYHLLAYLLSQEQVPQDASPSSE